MSFFFFLRVFYLFNDLHRYYGCSEGTEGSSGEATTTTTGPNDARRIVWALGEFFLFFLRVFYLFNDLHRYYKVQYGSTQATTATTGPR